MREELFEYCHTFCDSKLERIKGEIEKIRMALTSETKSTAGDKHETGRAMLQLEREKLGRQLLEAEKMKQLMNRIPINSNDQRIAAGSLVETEKAKFFISISAGKYQSEQGRVFCISASSPIGQLLLGKSRGDTIVFNGVEQRIVKVF